MTADTLHYLGEIATILYTVFILGHILNRGLIEKTLDDLSQLDEEEK